MPVFVGVAGNVRPDGLFIFWAFVFGVVGKLRPGGFGFDTCDMVGVGVKGRDRPVFPWVVTIPGGTTGRVLPDAGMVLWVKPAMSHRKQKQQHNFNKLWCHANNNFSLS